MTNKAALSAQGGILRSPDLADDPDIFPLLPGEGFPKKGPAWSTTSLISKSGRRFGRQNWSYPTWRFNVSYATLSQAPSRRDQDRLFAFFNRRAGGFGSFSYFDPTDYLVAGQPLGTGDGVTTAFQLIRSFQTWSEPVFALNGPPAVTIGGVPVANFEIAAPGVIVFSTPPGAGETVAWSGQFLFLCHFTQDELDTQQLNDHLFSNDGLSFETLKL
ncbi:MAG TPA: DUF2460 domain-containing protein [Rhizomicrobium sp.]